MGRNDEREVRDWGGETMSVPNKVVMIAAGYALVLMCSFYFYGRFGDGYHNVAFFFTGVVSLLCFAEVCSILKPGRTIESITRKAIRGRSV